MKKLSKILHISDNLLGTPVLKKSPGDGFFPDGNNNSVDPLLEAVARGDIKSYADLLDRNSEANEILTSRHYMKVSRLKKKILEGMYDFDYSGSMRTRYNRCRYEVHRSLTLAHVLKIKGHGQTAMELWQKTLLKARKYSLTWEAYVCAQHLCYEFAFRRKYAAYYNTVRSTRKLMSALSAEQEASALYNRLVLVMKGKWYINPSYKKLASVTSKRITALAVAHQTHELYSMHFRARFYRFYAEHNYRALLNTCRRYRIYLNNHKHLQQDSRWAEIALHQMNAAVSSGNYSYGSRLAQENRKYMRPENPNWFSYLENYFQLLMNAGEYQKAKALYGEVMTSAYKKNMSDRQADAWKVFLAYLHLALHSSGMISRFKPRRHFSVLTACKSDKAGLNFLIEAGMLMYILIREDQGNIERHGERFKKYVKRHIVKKKMPRHYLFSKLLLLMVRHRHRPAQHIRKLGSAHYRALNTAVPGRPHDFEANELIRFERLWEILLEQVTQEMRKMSVEL